MYLDYVSLIHGDPVTTTTASHFLEHSFSKTQNYWLHVRNRTKKIIFYTYDTNFHLQFLNTATENHILIKVIFSITSSTSIFKFFIPINWQMKEIQGLESLAAKHTMPFSLNTKLINITKYWYSISSDDRPDISLCQIYRYFAWIIASSKNWLHW